ncbi:unnamed protein product [Scytosiphon promiscuus]
MRTLGEMGWRKHAIIISARVARSEVWLEAYLSMEGIIRFGAISYKEGYESLAFVTAWLNQRMKQSPVNILHLLELRKFHSRCSIFLIRRNAKNIFSGCVTDFSG